MLDFRYFVVIEIPEDGILVPKHVGDGTEHGVRFMVCVLVCFTWCILLVNVLNVGESAI